jgi:hypothetical protein
MALTGRLSDFSPLQLLALVQKTGKTGALVLEHWGQTATVYFQDGKLTRVHEPSRSLASALLAAGKIDHEQFERLGAGLSEKAIAMALSDDGVLSREEVEEFVRQSMVEALIPLLTWTDGTFRMELGAAPSEEDIVVPSDMATTLALARAQMAEWTRLMSAIPRLDVPIRLVAEPDPASGQIQLTAQEWRLVVALTGELSLLQLAQQLGLDELVVRRIARRLVASGLATLPASPPAPLTAASSLAPASQPPRDVPPSAVPPEAEREAEQPKGGALSRFLRRK